MVRYLVVLPVHHSALKDLLTQEELGAFQSLMKRSFQVRKLASFRVFLEAITISQVKIVAGHDRITAAAPVVPSRNRTKPALKGFYLLPIERSYSASGRP